ncbi:hypothetical protein CERSUDRAFT_96954 [Gelatoporia subvermispora B]|uniref:Uncharacterized protein n=1 Tax=Ceriporiopsis subvermispora (strain B) TaxID=914234 RepID=M2PGC4_CERS8|nr:hypothetical protein CERSUDRAFT_96954 [Gelatoporia subvermispora B]
MSWFSLFSRSRRAPAPSPVPVPASLQFDAGDDKTSNKQSSTAPLEALLPDGLAPAHLTSGRWVGDEFAAQSEWSLVLAMTTVKTPLVSTAVMPQPTARSEAAAVQHPVYSTPKSEKATNGNDIKTTTARVPTLSPAIPRYEVVPFCQDQLTDLWRLTGLADDVKKSPAIAGQSRALDPVSAAPPAKFASASMKKTRSALTDITNSPSNNTISMPLATPRAESAPIKPRPPAPSCKRGIPRHPDLANYVASMKTDRSSSRSPDGRVASDYTKPKPRKGKTVRFIFPAVPPAVSPETPCTPAAYSEASIIDLYCNEELPLESGSGSEREMPYIVVSGSDGDVRTLADDQDGPFAAHRSVPAQRAMSQSLIDEMSLLEDELMYSPLAASDADIDPSEYPASLDDACIAASTGKSSYDPNAEEDDFDFDTGPGAIRINGDGEVVFDVDDGDSVVLDPASLVDGPPAAPSRPCAQSATESRVVDLCEMDNKADGVKEHDLLSPGLWNWQVPRHMRPKKPPLRSILKKRSPPTIIDINSIQLSPAQPATSAPAVGRHSSKKTTPSGPALRQPSLDFGTDEENQLFRNAERFRERYFQSQTNAERFEQHRRLQLERAAAAKAQAVKRSRLGPALGLGATLRQLLPAARAPAPRAQVDLDYVRHRARQLRVRLDRPFLDRAMCRPDTRKAGAVVLNRFYAARGGKDYFLTTGGDFVEVSKSGEIRALSIPHAPLANKCKDKGGRRGVPPPNRTQRLTRGAL